MARRGYTLVEMVTVIVILAVLAAFLAPVLSNAVSAYDTTSRSVEVQMRVRYALERMAREMRSMRKDPANSLQFDIIAGTMANNKLEFCAADGTAVTIDAAAVAGEVKLGYGAAFTSTCTAGAGTTQTLTDGVTTFTLIYCRNDGVTCTPGSTVDRSDIAFADITLTVTDTVTGASTSQMRVDLRNP